ncbi:MAG: hypothetical protein HXY44_13580 [Syntrophaceae bacterium]|nr:hypothetical protein [Syntrophaceae bacterium]
MGRLVKYGNIILPPLVLSVGSLLIKKGWLLLDVALWREGITHNQGFNFIPNPIIMLHSIFTHIHTSMVAIILILTLLPLTVRLHPHDPHLLHHLIHVINRIELENG